MGITSNEIFIRCFEKGSPAHLQLQFICIHFWFFYIIPPHLIIVNIFRYSHKYAHNNESHQLLEKCCQIHKETVFFFFFFLRDRFVTLTGKSSN